jgi:hypothetical protein
VLADVSVVIHGWQALLLHGIACQAFVSVFGRLGSVE